MRTDGRAESICLCVQIPITIIQERILHMSSYDRNEM